ncbi:MULTISPECIES: hypothetical protein [unclassified Neisseria]|uniref:hypothetical protein n=1 Tax=unclassified Neisseria TaxID=2623750 RepID=UPI001072D97F|nr:MULTISPECIES: hypothetical protein [unclassified Neisseria]MBF0803804.1 hypothetical protein [Neisseria sp. 19428wB4_WF04]TFU43476.1 hypothetical protein E4T99_05460 [Neisseria sp. WF04]
MHLTLALPALNRNTDAAQPATVLPSLNKMMRFGSYTATPARPSEFYGRFLWHGSLLERAKPALGIGPEQAAVFASPVWQQMGMHHMDMLGGGDIQIQAHEAETFCLGLSRFLQTDGWHFHPLRPDLWLVALPAQPDWQAAPVLDVLGRIDDSVRAEGTGSRVWLQKQTEIQMWLHAHPLNAKRAAARVPTVNGVWLWRDIAGSRAGNPLLGSSSPWAQFYPGSRTGAPDDFDAWMETTRRHNRPVSDGLLFLDDLAVTRHTDDAWAYKEILESWEQRWFAPLWQALQQGRLNSLTIATDGPQGGSLTLNPKAARAFWKKKKTFAGNLGG